MQFLLDNLHTYASLNALHMQCTERGIRTLKHPNSDPYARNRENDGKYLRIVTQIPKAEIDAVDGWGVSAGMGSRSAAIRTLIRKGLESVEAGASPAHRTL